MSVTPEIYPQPARPQPAEGAPIHPPRPISYSVSHAIPGRVRFRVPRVATDPQYVRRLAALADADARITGLRVNFASASVVISYRPGTVSDGEMRDHMAAGLFQSALDAPQPALAAAQPSGQGGWGRLVLPAVSVGLAVLGGPLGASVPAPLFAGVIAAAAAPIARRAAHSVAVERRLNIDVLDVLAIALTTLQGSFVTPAVTIGLVELGEAIRERTARASRREALDLLSSLGQFAWVERDGEQRQAPVEEVRRGDILVVYPGDLIPADGRVIEGRALIGEEHLTGEAAPVVREQGQQVYASTVMQEGQLRIGVELTGAETRAGQIMRVMQEAPVNDTRIENYAATVADRAVLPTLLLSGAVLAATRNPSRAAAVLITDFATGIRVSVPTTILAALTAATRRGIIIRSGRALEQLGKIDTVVFDKTGTVTQGRPAVAQVESVREGAAPVEVLAIAASAEQHLTHPAAEAVVRHAREMEAAVYPCEEWEYHVGLGVRARIGGRKVLVGSRRLMQREGIPLDRLNEAHPSSRAEDRSVIYVAGDDELCGTIAYSDPLRPESRGVLAALRGAGMEIHLLTGDNPRTAGAVARELGIPAANTHAEVFPEQKAAVIQRLRAEGKTVAFVGDGINDSPALAYADVSVSFRGGADAARETADVVLMEDDLRGLTDSMAISRRAMELIRQNIGIVAGPNLAALVLAATVGLGPVTATVINHGTMVIAGVNGLRPLVQDDRPMALQPAHTGMKG